MKRSETCPAVQLLPQSSSQVSSTQSQSHTPPPTLTRTVPNRVVILSSLPNCSIKSSSSALNVSNNNNNVDWTDNSVVTLTDAELTDEPVASAVDALREELVKAQRALELKNAECRKLTSDQLQTGVEVEELTASLFEEANKMVQDANVKRMTAEKLLKEARTKIDVLVAEVTALKTLVITSTPSKPNPHLNPQIDKAKKEEFTRGHKRSTSHHTVPATKLVEVGGSKTESGRTKPKEDFFDPHWMAMFKQWKINPGCSSPFLERIRAEDILPCIRFNNEQLSQQVYEGIVSNTLTIEPLPPNTNAISATTSNDKNNTTQCCALSNAPAVCSYAIKLGDLPTTYAVSQATRNRIIAVCDFTTYIRYIAQGLVKCSDEDMFLEVTKLRRRMCLSRLGFDE